MTTITQQQDGTSVASVRTITAEVRVLTVGSRQITLSVANQLDRVRRDRIEPMGRIRTKNGEELIGRNVEDGTLVRSRMSYTGATMEHPFWVEPPAPIVVCSTIARDWANKVVHVRCGVEDEDHVHVAIPLGATQDCGLLHSPHTEWCRCEANGQRHSPKQTCEMLLSQEQTDSIRAEIAEERANREAAIALMRHDKALPLIVLAGLA